MSSPESRRKYQQYLDANRASWDETVAVHAASEFYGVDRFLAGESTLLPLDLEELGDGSAVAGKTLLHLQCHFGLDTLSWARLGARVTGLDFAPAAVAQARDLTSRAGLKAEFVESDLYDAPQALGDRLGGFDYVYVNLGALCWLPDVRGWARICAGFLKPGGVLYVRDTHPLAFSLDYQAAAGEYVLRYDYFQGDEPFHDTEAADYADPNASFENTDRYEWNHGLGDVVSAVVEAGLTVEFLHEQDWTVYRALPWFVETERGIYRPPERGGQPDRRAPLMFSLRARLS